MRTLRDPDRSGTLDRALLLWFPGPDTATGEDLAEIHAHGGRAVVRAIESALDVLPGLRRAEPGEFTRRSLMNGRIDLAEAEGLADLLSAETESQRKAALSLASGGLSRFVEDWQARLLSLSAQVEALLDFSDEEDVGAGTMAIGNIISQCQLLECEWRQWLARAVAERLTDGLVVVIAGPPNAGKSTLLNALAQREAAIVSPIAGTTRDIVEVPIAIEGIPFRLADTAGLRDGSNDPIEAIGMARAAELIDRSDMLLWLGTDETAPVHPHLLCVAAKADLHVGGCDERSGEAVALSAVTGAGMDELYRWLRVTARNLLPVEGETLLHRRHRAALSDATESLTDCSLDPLILAEQLRHARLSIDTITGRSGTEAMLDALFGRFCIGK